MSGSQQAALKRMTRICKDCGNPFVFPAQAAEHDVAVGLSVSTRCSKCRAIKRVWNGSHPVAYIDHGDYPSVALPADQVLWGLSDEVTPHMDIREIKSSGKLTEKVTANFAKVNPYVEKIVANLNDPRGKRVSLLVVPTGWGKSTWLPYCIMLSPLGARARILVTQPRTATMRGSEDGNWQGTLPGFISSQLLECDGIGAGQHIGLQYRGESTMHDRYNKLVFVTDGICIQYLKSDAIDRFQVLVIDEAHEQSSNMELIFALLKEKLIRYPNLRVVIASATIDPAPFVAYYGGPDQVLVSGPEPSSVDTKNLVVDRWPSDPNGFAAEAARFLEKDFSLPPLGRQNKDLPERVAEMVRCIREDPGFTSTGEPRGDILVFMPTIAMVDRTIEAVRALKLASLEALPCHAQMDEVEARRFRAGQKRAELAALAGKLTTPQRVIVATNYAETSVTFVNLKYVIDTGLISEPHWDSEAWCKDQRPRTHTQAGCWQRRGRVGRTAPGEVFHLYEEADFRNALMFREFPLPEVRRSRLDSIILTLAAAGMPYEHLSFLGEQGDDVGLARREIARAVASLRERGVFDAQGDPTEYGLLLAGLETSSVEAAAFMSESARFACSLEAATFLAFAESALRLFLRDSRGEVGYALWSAGCRDDLELFLRIYHHWEKASSEATEEVARLENEPGERNANLKKGAAESAQARWARENGLNHNALVKVREGRARLLAPFSRATHTKTEDRELDLERLHKTRFVLAKTLADWIYVKADEVDERTEARLYQPLGAKWLSSTERVSISPESACFDGRCGPQAFIAMERVKGRNGITCRNVVCVDLKWVDDIKQNHWLKAGRSADAKLVTAVMQAEADARGLTAQVVKAVPSGTLADVKAYRPGGNFRGKVIRLTLDRDDFAEERTKRYLVKDGETGHFLVTELRGAETISAGSLFRAQVVSADVKGGIVTLGQDAIRNRHYGREGALVPGARVMQALKNEFGDIDAFRLELEAGITGIYRLRDGEHRADFVQAITETGTLEVRIAKLSDGKIYLRTEAEVLVESATYYGEIVRFLDSGDGALVRIGPHPQSVGLLHYSRVPFDIWQTLEVRRWVKVYLHQIRIDGDRRRLSLNWDG